MPRRARLRVSQYDRASTSTSSPFQRHAVSKGPCGGLAKTTEPATHWREAWRSARSCSTAQSYAGVSSKNMRLFPIPCFGKNKGLNQARGKYSCSPLYLFLPAPRHPGRGPALDMKRAATRPSTGSMRCRCELDDSQNPSHPCPLISSCRLGLRPDKGPRRYVPERKAYKHHLLNRSAACFVNEQICSGSCRRKNALLKMESVAGGAPTESTPGLSAPGRLVPMLYLDRALVDLLFQLSHWLRG